MRIGRPPKAPKIERTCEVCGEKWFTYAWNQNRTKYCSRECWRVSRIGRPNPHKLQPQYKNCAYCGTPFRYGGMGHAAHNVKHCSKKCAAQARIESGVIPYLPAREDLTCEERAWLAGVFDGEGTIAWPRRTALHSVRLDIANTCLPFLEKIKEVTGTGRIYIRSVQTNPRHNQAYYWSVGAKNALIILRQIHPWLIIKKHAAEVALGLVEATEPPPAMRTRKAREAEAMEKAEVAAVEHVAA